MMEAKTATPSTSSAKKRKVEIATQSLKSPPPPPPPYAQLNKKPRRRVVSVSKIVRENAGVREVKDADDDADAFCVSPSSSSGSDHVEEASCCSSNGSSELVEDGNMKFVDLEVLIQTINSNSNSAINSVLSMLLEFLGFVVSLAAFIAASACFNFTSEFNFTE